MRIPFIFGLVASVHASGVAVHMSLVDMIAPLLPPRLHHHLDYVRAGAFYPDAFYDCFGHSDAAEHAHWPPFLDAGIQLINERRYRKKSTDRLEAFLLGVMTHQVADISWHSLGVHQGLLRKMADTEFLGVYADAHTVLDLGGDLILLNRMNVNHNRISADWNYSKRDIQDLLEIMGYPDFTRGSIGVCMNRGRAALRAEKRICHTGFKRFARRSPLMFDELQTYFAGGLTDMYLQIQECIPNLLKWMKNPNHLSSPWDLCQVYHGRKPHRRRKLRLNHRALPVTRSTPQSVSELSNLTMQFPVVNKHTEQQLGPLGPTSAIRSTDLVVRDTSMEVQHLYPRDRFAKAHHSVDSIIEIAKDLAFSCKDHLVPEKPHKLLHCYDIIPAPSVVMNTNLEAGPRKYPGFGRSMIFWGKHLVVGAPDEGKVYIYNEHFHVKREIRSGDPIKRTGEFATRFGAALTIWKNFLVVSSPGLSKLDFFDCQGKWNGGVKWHGSMKVYGHRGAKLIGETLANDRTFDDLFVGAPYLDHDVHTQVGAVYSLPLSILVNAVRTKRYQTVQVCKHVLYRGEKNYEQAGKRMTFTPQHLLVGSPGIGKVHGFQYDTKRMVVTLKEPAHLTHKPTGFGGNLLIGTRDLVFIGSPAKSSLPCNNQNGVITVYKQSKAKEVYINDDFAWFGRNGVGAGHNLYVASPHAGNGHGMLWKIDLRDHTSAELGVPFHTFGAQFGSSMATNGTFLAIGMPEYSNNFQVRRGGIVIVPVK